MKLTSSGWEIEDCRTRLPFFCSKLPAGTLSFVLCKHFCVYFFYVQTNVQVLARSTGNVTVSLVLVRVSRDGVVKTAPTFTATTSTTVPVMERAWGRINVVAELVGRQGTDKYITGIFPNFYLPFLGSRLYDDLLQSVHDVLRLQSPARLWLV